MFGWFRRERVDPDVVNASPRAPTRVTLTVASTIAGIEFPAGTRVLYWETTLEDATDGRAARVPCEIEVVAGLRIDHLSIPANSRLAFAEGGILEQVFVEEPCDLVDVPCGSDTVLTRGNAGWWVSETVLARDHEIDGARYPRGARLKLDEQGHVKSASHGPVAAPAGYALAIRNLYPTGRPERSALEAMPISQGATSPSGFVEVELSARPLGPVLAASTISDPSLRTLGDLRRHYPSDGTFELHVTAWGQPIAVRVADGAQFSITVEAGMLTFDEKVLDDGHIIYDTTEIERVD